MAKTNEGRMRTLDRVLVAVGVVLLAGAVLFVANLVRLQGPGSEGAPPSVDSAAVPPVGEIDAAIGGATGEADGSTDAGTLDPASAGRPTDRVDPAWLERTAAATGIPARALLAYASAQLAILTEDAACGIGWNTLAGIGAIESDHGRHGGAVLGSDGYPDPAIRGIPLDGDGTAEIHDTDGGAWDGDTVWDRAVGPMQFIPDTWARWGADGNGDGTNDPNQIDDAALAAVRYLCASGPATTAEGWRAAIFSYNHLDSYVDDVADVANRYAAAVG